MTIKSDEMMMEEEEEEEEEVEHDSVPDGQTKGYEKKEQAAGG